MGGSIKFGNRVKVGYYAQHHADTLSGERTLFEEVSLQDATAGQTRVRSVLGAFLFSGDDVDKPIRVLSGGERARVALARLLIKPGNLLLMDEPTNHLDLESSESLAESLRSYDGTLLFVSHNRSFVRKLATRIWDVSGGKVETYPGTLDEYMDSSRRRRDGEVEAPKGERALSHGTGAKGQVAAAAVVAAAPAAGRSKQDRRREAEARNERNRALAPLRKRIAEMEARIGGLEQEQKQRSAALADPETYANEAKRRDLLMAYQRDADKLEELTGRWETAVAELEAAEAAE